jgi:hypothetical protein
VDEITITNVDAHVGDTQVIAGAVGLEEDEIAGLEIRIGDLIADLRLKARAMREADPEHRHDGHGEA